MTTTGLQLLGFVLGVIAWAGMIATMASPVWRKNSIGGTALDEHKRLETYFYYFAEFLTSRSFLLRGVSFSES